MSTLPIRVSLVADAAAERVTAFLRTVYGWMFIGLGLTAAVASAVAGSPAIMQTVASNHTLFAGALIAELGLVFYLSSRVQNLTPTAATMLFLLYAGLNGVTLSVLLLALTGESIATTFVATGGCSERSPSSVRRRSTVWPAQRNSSTWA